MKLLFVLYHSKCTEFLCYLPNEYIKDEKISIIFIDISKRGAFFFAYNTVKFVSHIQYSYANEK